MKEFDWEYCKSVRSNNVYLWLKENHPKKVSVEDFVVVMRALGKANRLAGEKKHLNARKFSHKLSTRELSYNYRKLVENFGFFQGV